MPRRVLPLFITFGLLAAACSTTAADTAANTVEETATDETQNTTAPPPPEEPAGDQPEEPFIVEGPGETFLPPLEGPFAEGGVNSADFDRANVIVEDPPGLPRLLANLPWETDWSQRTPESFGEFFAGLNAIDPRDIIPPIDTPIFESVDLAAEWLDPNEPGALVQVNGEARFYSLSILTQHEIVNDAFGDVPVAVTFCPLCNTALAFDRRVDGQVLRFGVSGLLRNSDLVMWDDQTTSLWQQISGEGVVGEFAGVDLETVPTQIVSFRQFVESFPDGFSLAGESGRGRQSYGANPYAGYSSLAQPFLFDGVADDRLPALSRVIGITEGDSVAAYSFDEAVANRVINDEIDGLAIVVLAGGATTDALDQRSIAGSRNIGSAVAHNPVVDGETLTFAPDGDDTFTDDQTGSTWSITGIATAGPLEGTQLGPIEHRNEFWFAFQAFLGPDSLREL